MWNVPDIHQLVVLGSVSGPMRESGAIRIARLRKVGPIRRGYVGDFDVGVGPRKVSDAQVIQHVKELRAVDCPDHRELRPWSRGNRWLVAKVIKVSFPLAVF